VKGLRFRIALASMTVSAVALLAVLLLAGPRLRARAIDETTATLFAEASLIAASVEQPVASGMAMDALDALVDEASRKVQSRVTLVGLEGRVLGDSAVSGADLLKLENHGTRPEVLQALATGRGVSIRHSATIGQDLLYVAVPVRRTGSAVAVLRVARSLADIDDEVRRFEASVGAALLIAFVITGIVSTLFASRLAGPLQDLMRAARRFAAGDIEVSVPVQRDDEVGELARILNKAIGQLQVRLAEAVRDGARTQAILFVVEDGLLAVDHEGTVLLANPSLERTLELAANPVGEHYLAVVRHSVVAGLVDAVLKTGSRQEAEAEFQRVGRTCLVVAVPFPGAAGAPHGAVLTFHDVTERRRVEQLRKDFVANASHELRTPLTSIRGYVEALEDGSLTRPEQAERFLGKIRLRADQMAALIADLLELSHAESRARPLAWQPVRLEQLVDEAVSALSAQAAQKRLTLQVVARTPATVVTDPEYLRRMVENIIDNAVKYTPPEGRVEVSLSSDSAGACSIEVRDTGPGISPEHLPRIFERFYRVDQARSRDMGGTGLGLAIVKHLAERLGIQVDVRSEVGTGSTFTLRVPAAPVPNGLEARPPARPAAAPLP
jgi:two-component system phosphate regulon sensor histidine kinase PhoR